MIGSAEVDGRRTEPMTAHHPAPVIRRGQGATRNRALAPERVWIVLLDDAIVGCCRGQVADLENGRLYAS